MKAQQDINTPPEHTAPGAEIHADPLLDCLVELTRHHGHVMTRDALVAGLPLTRHLLTPALLPRAASRAGLSARLLRSPLEDIEPALLPALLLLHDNQACLLLGWADDNRAHVMLPHSGGGTTFLPAADLRRRYTGMVFFVQPRFRFEERSDENAAPAPSGHWFWSTVREASPLYRDALVAAFLVNCFGLVAPLLTMIVYDRVVPNHAMETLWVLVLGAFLVLGFDFTMRMLRGYIIDLASRQVDLTLSARIMERVLGMHLEARPRSVGSFAANLRAFETVRDFIASTTATALIDLPFTALFLLVTLWIEPWMVIPPLLGVTFAISYGLFVQRRMRELASLTHRAGAQRNAVLVEGLIGLESIKTLGAEGQLQGRWEQNTRYQAEVASKLRLLAASATNLTLFLQQATLLSILVVGVYAIGNADLSQGGLIACVMLAGRALGPLSQVAALLTQFNSARSALEGVSMAMELPLERPPERQFLHRPQLAGRIEFRNVSFSYPHGAVPALQQVSFRIEPGERVAIIGRVGSGKTTLEKLILGLYTPSEGAVLLDGIDARQLDPAEMRRNIGYVPQTVELFYGSLRDNILLGSPHATDDQLLSAAQIAGVDRLAATHPHGYDLLIDERGESLSGGQRQEIALARALLRDPPVLLLDEPTSSMDFATEELLKRNLVNFCSSKTLIVVTHRNSLLDLVDRLIVMDGGRVVADGPKQRVVAALQAGQVRARA
ncbi:MAG TPA: type I secretion system permease/ATPase [Moraxellaceae bacterium]|nr:type I secretion system permease/ATPase [Moraxellaceae bacterium]